MRGAPIYIAGMGIISALGCGVTETAEALKQARCGLRPLTLFAVTADAPLAVGQVDLRADPADPLPRTHRLAQHGRRSSPGRHDPCPGCHSSGHHHRRHSHHRSASGKKHRRPQWLSIPWAGVSGRSAGPELRVQRSVDYGIHRLFFRRRGPLAGHGAAAQRQGPARAGRRRGQPLPPDLFRL